MELLKNIAEMGEEFEPNILHPKVINDETELDGTPFVAPEARGGFSFVISFSKKAGLEEIVGKDAGLAKAITALANFKVNPTITLATFKFVFLNEFHQKYSGSGIGVSRSKFLRSMERKSASGWESTLLRSSLTSSSDAVLVPTSPSKQMQLPPMVMWVWSGSSFSGCTSHTTRVWQISFCLWDRML
jgi:hypothetical protein